jgi:hypothetical protein
MISVPILVIAYLIYALSDGAPIIDDTKGWATVVLIFIGICIMLQTVIQLVHMTHSVSAAAKERDMSNKDFDKVFSSEMAEDEMDKLISMKSVRTGYIIVCVGIIAALFILAFGQPVIYALHTLLGAFLAGSLTEGCIAVYLYERGVRNG